MYKNCSLYLAAWLISLLVGCAQPDKQTATYQAPVQDRQVLISPLSPQVVEKLSRLQDTDEWITQQAAALTQADLLAWKTVRDNKITVDSKCRTIPPALRQYPLFPRFKELMTDQYRGKCLTAVEQYRKEQAAKAKAKK